jgi:hypothetical protein
MINSNDATIMRCMSDNIKGKFSLLASQLPGMSVKSFNGIQYVDCGRQSDTFNTVFGMPSGADDIETITSYYRQKKIPAAWWLSGSPNEFREKFQQSGWVYEENEVGMQLDLGGQLVISQSVFSRIEFCDSAERFQDFGSEIFRQAVRAAQQRGAKTCVLQASPDGLNIYERHGFVSSGNFEVWNLPHES